jgi:multiple sugar transport system substrate-binding protein
MSRSDRMLVLCGREFDGFTRSFTDQFALLPELPARAELIEIQALEEMVLTGAEVLDGSIDLLLLNTDWLPSLIASGRVLSLDSYLAVAPPEGWPDAWVPSLRALQTGADGQVYGVAYHDGPVMLIYRRDLYESSEERSGFVDKYGYPLAPPTTWREYLDHAHWFNRPEIGLRGTVLAGLPDQHNNIYDFLTHLWSRGGELVLEDGTSGLNSSAALDAAAFVHSLWHVDEVVDPAAAQWDSVESGIHFAAGEAAMMVNWCGFAALSADPASPTHGLVAATSAPSGDGPDGSVATMNAYWVLAVAAGCTEPDRAYDLIRSIAAPEMDVITARSQGSAVRRDTWSRPDVQTLAPYYAALESAHAGARAIPRDPDWPRMAEILNDMMAAVVTGADPATSLHAAHDQLTAFLAGRHG